MVSIYQIERIQDTILAYFFTNNSGCINSAPYPLITNISHKLELEETLPSSPAEVPHIEEHYLGKFSTPIGIFLQVI